MSRIHIILEDMEDGSINVRCVSDRPIPAEIEQWTGAELLARQTAEAIDTLMKRQQGETDAK